MYLWILGGRKISSMGSQKKSRAACLSTSLCRRMCILYGSLGQQCSRETLSNPVLMVDKQTVCPERLRHVCPLDGLRHFPKMTLCQ